MDGKDTLMKGGSHTARRWIAVAALVASGAIAGGIIAGTQVAGAAGTSSTAPMAPPSMSAQAPIDMKHGPGEALLTGSEASKVEAAAFEAVPAGTIIRVETDDEGAAYEAHVQKSDGSVVTVKMDKDFAVTDTIDGFGAGAPPMGASVPRTSSSSTSA